MVYFISDAHLGSKLVNDPRQHELFLVSWLDMVKADATAIYMLGDMFDFWFEYSTVVPKGFVRFLGKLAQLSDQGIQLHFFTGNHDIWTFGYLETEIGLKVHRSSELLNIGNKRFFLGHGDGLYAEEKGFKILRKIFHSTLAQKLFSCIPPKLGQNFGYMWSKNNRLKVLHIENKFQGEDKETLVLFSKKYIKTHDVDFLVFGHRHIALDLELRNKKRMVILGDFVSIFSYAAFDGENLQLHYLEN